jgi:TolA-binding protein
MRRLLKQGVKRRTSGPARFAARLGWFLNLAVLCSFALWSAKAQETPESRAFKDAARWYQTGVYDAAEEKFRKFAADFPQSPMLAEAILFQARAALEQTNLTGAITLLNQHLPKAGLLTDQYRYRLGTAYLQSGNFQEAAESFSLIARKFPNSDLLLESSYGEALARFKFKDFDRVIGLLQDANGAFQQASATRASDRFALAGALLLAEALFEQKRYGEAEAVARRLAEKNLTPASDWDRQYLLCRLQIASQRPTEALLQTTNLARLALETGNRNLVADSVALRAGILQQLDRLDEALEVYTNNLAASVPADRRRLALLNIIEIKLAQDKTAEAEQMLQEFVATQPGDAASDVARLTAGELQLKLHFAEWAAGDTNGAAVQAPATNRVQLALAQFEKLIELNTNSPLRGKAWLNKGWCHWLEQQTGESVRAFRAAISLLPFSEDLAVARFKLGDALFQQGDYTNALGFYRSVTNDFKAMPRVRESLFDQVLFQIVRASIEVRDAEGAMGAMNQLLQWFPETSSSERSLWLVGQELIRARQQESARRVFTNFVQRFPGRPLLPKVELAIARTYFHERNWPAAIREYEAWLIRYPTNELRPRAEFNRAWATDKAGQSTNAFELFTHFVARFPNDELAPRAQHWVADEFYRRGNPVEALANYQKILENTNWLATNLTYQARMMAGRSAFAAQLWKSAAEHFTALLNDLEHCPVELAAEAHIALGDTFVSEAVGTGSPVDKFADAKTAFDPVARLSIFVTNRLAQRLVPLALGRIGDCSLQLAGQDPKQYAVAADAYWRVVTNQVADISTRSLAAYGLGRVFESEAADHKNPAERGDLLKAAFDQYFAILIGQNLRDGEKSEPAWIEKAGLAAARLKEAQGEWQVALNVYQRMLGIEEMAPLHRRLQEKVSKAREKLGDAKN